MKSYRITVNGQSYDVTVEEVGSALPTVAASQSQPRAQAAPAAPSSQVSGAVQAKPGAAQVKAGAAQAKPGAAQVRAPMPGTLLAYKVAAGQAVRQGDVLLILEAMKMENEITAPADGVVAALGPAEGAAVSSGDLLVSLG
jgi:glutaconyl-CoA decarboxylase